MVQPLCSLFVPPATNSSTELASNSFLPWLLVGPTQEKSQSILSWFSLHRALHAQDEKILLSICLMPQLALFSYHYIIFATECSTFNLCFCKARLYVLFACVCFLCCKSSSFIHRRFGTCDQCAHAAFRFQPNYQLSVKAFQTKPSRLNILKSSTSSKKNCCSKTYLKANMNHQDCQLSLDHTSIATGFRNASLY